MEYKIIIVGIGPGSPEYLLPAAKAAIEQAHYVVGSRRALADYAKQALKTQVITGEVEATFAFIEENVAVGDVTVLVSGDPGYYSLLAALRKRFNPKLLQVIPGISAMQLAFARLALPWQNARLISLHGRLPQEDDLRYQEGAVLGLLTDTGYHSQKIAELLAARQWPDTTKVCICSRLSYEDEQIIQTTLGAMSGRKEISHCIMVVIA